jgi:hypothetical protein
MLVLKAISEKGGSQNAYKPTLTPAAMPMTTGAMMRVAMYLRSVPKLRS